MGDLFILPDIALSVTKRLAGETGDDFNITRISLGKRLDESNRLYMIDGKRETLTVRRKLSGQVHDVYYLHLDTIRAEKPDIGDFLPGMGDASGTYD